MQNLGNIIEAVLDGQKPEYDDLRYAICVMSSLMTFDRLALHKLAEGERENKRKFLSYSAEFQSNERFERIKRAWSKPPAEWLGVENDPDSSDVQKRRKMHIKLVNKIIEKEIENENS